MAAEVSNMILRNIGAIPSSVSFANATIAQGFRHFPSYINTKSAAQLPIASFIGRILYPWGVSFLIPIFVVAIVKEKEARVEVMMEMNGLKRSTYFLTQYIQYLVLALASAIVFIVAGTALRMDMFTTTGKAVLPILFFIWANVQVSLAFFFGSFFSKSRSALIMSFLVILCSVVVALAIDALYSGNLNPVFFIWPPFAFYRSLTRINNASWRRSLRPYELSSLAFPDEVGVAMVFMVVEIPVYLLLSYYLGKVLPSEYGVRRPFWFPVTDAINFFQSRSTSRSPGGSGSLSRKDIAIVTPEHEQPQSSAPLHRSTSSHLVTIPEEDDDVRDERKRIEAGEYDPTRTPLVIKGMRKVYEGRMGKGAKVAVKNITVAAEAGKVFGLLGPNGAGKTTLISILTGIYPPTSGEAIIAGYNISTNMAEVHRNIGICPQHDILWDDLTVEEHLLFYARLKGVPAQDESKAVAESMKAVALEKFAGRLSKGLSGGEKRRLSIAIALVGDPACVFLDEPTTGLDPEVRRMIWDIIVKARKHKTIILTTHSMEEAEVLCSRIGIMAKGTMRCLGSVLRLKQLYGAGFKLTLSAAAEDMRRASGYVESLLPSGAYERIDSFQTSAAYEFKPSPGLVGQLFEILQRDSKANGITDWGISETSLEEVFLEIITDEDASAD
ncbi:P-loop containing nucleoside triphosphate hydrolase protein [Gonapodya prolifera JEL478]|uniref:p-loop containing nucleoside triphosphate hydrolase protein n=1 Tax=Gonapodya prolifera (strain JEL478) TaxID=1344416 RepID=A0A138ZY97_GONPJ|nr:P-loop containing nucleoside triphosphate hydrolase protein [Gonapodya prolifera JEL478]|eukprot:KXS09467.1 P-loop containing nucleoside triphosphate hydrolase protein [Gonapodya prolifera JEL478]